MTESNCTGSDFIYRLNEQYDSQYMDSPDNDNSNQDVLPSLQGMPPERLSRIAKKVGAEKASPEAILKAYRDVRALCDNKLNEF
ncbi:MAG: hypothetical protein UR28_C0030G0012 [Candidatus Peregrinibacteria bacterium GW2011_GWF2_33_10]|nr:MAG: hypothetical protein UR28_C0030G0012 [Candidatus Peregrinibacteria bacterium GW2011_GWF2_33_10]OGJ45136.1 MAG: hypothetical protein A2263_05275 [Candidatus Peregrinibacteria bacterium RIFOXYA2_FULL_33_21]OGJ46506.1 MAG: hypothetical protein A2272_04910 [Candidatus Peregrinibacteria bacterium RIFOXYA12_FULL_33_12]OGJ50805.1 MAG: hypothetical protein A2307_02045 [Candidatus Peregrinibacteria bacterium RIFOXYB2_FULL_33_20]